MVNKKQNLTKPIRKTKGDLKNKIMPCGGYPNKFMPFSHPALMQQALEATENILNSSWSQANRVGLRLAANPTYQTNPRIHQPDIRHWFS
jgi:hypothetical protein